MKELFNYLIFGIAFLVCSCASDDTVDFACGEGQVFDCDSCQEIYQPVCGCNGETYDNACVANCSGVYEYTEGECP